MKNVILFLQKLNASELSILITIIMSCISGAFFVENRYAKLMETQKELSIQQTQIILLQRQLLSLVDALPEDIRQQIVNRSKVNQALQLNQSNQVTTPINQE